MRNSGWGSLGRTETEKWRAKGGVPQQPWHNTDVSLSLTLSLSLGPAWRGPMDPLLSRVPAPPHLCSDPTQIMWLTHRCANDGKRRPTRVTAHQNKQQSLICSLKRHARLLIRVLKDQSGRIPSLTTSKQWLSVHRLYFSSFALYDTTSWVWKYCDNASGRLQETTNI